MADSVLEERIIHRRLDPETGDIYHMKFKPPTDAKATHSCAGGARRRERPRVGMCPDRVSKRPIALT